MKHVLVAMTVLFSISSFSAQTYNIDVEKSQLRWVGSKLVGSSHDGDIKFSSGTVEIDKNKLLAGQFVVNMNTINNTDLASSPKDKAKLEGHLKSDDFFSVQKFPEAVFKITEVKETQNKKSKGLKSKHTHDIQGDLTIKGITHSVTIPATIEIKADMATAQGTFEIDRTLWNVRFGSKNFFENLAGDRIINNNIKFEMNLVAYKAASTPEKK